MMALTTMERGTMYFQKLVLRAMVLWAMRVADNGFMEHITANNGVAGSEALYNGGAADNRATYNCIADNRS